MALIPASAAMELEAPLAALGASIINNAETFASTGGSAAADLAARVIQRGFKKMKARRRTRRTKRRRTAATRSEVNQVRREAVGPAHQTISASGGSSAANTLYSFQLGRNIEQGSGPYNKRGDKIHYKGLSIEAYFRNVSTVRPRWVTFVLARAKTYKANAAGDVFFTQAGTGESVAFSSLLVNPLKAIRPLSNEHWAVKWRQTWKLPEDSATSWGDSSSSLLFKKWIPLKTMMRTDEDTVASETEFDVYPRYYVFWWFADDTGTTSPIDEEIYFHQYFT